MRAAGFFYLAALLIRNFIRIAKIAITAKIAIIAIIEGIQSALIRGRSAVKIALITSQL
jgi:hypothetical protein